MANNAKEYEINPKMFEKVNTILDKLVALEKARKELQKQIDAASKEYLNAEKPLNEDLVKHWNRIYNNKAPEIMLFSLAQQNLEKIFGKEKGDLIKRIKFGTQTISQKPK